MVVTANHSQGPNGGLDGKASIGDGGEAGNIRNVIRIDEGEIRNQLDGPVKTSVEEVLNQYLDHDPDQQCPGKDEP